MKKFMAFIAALGLLGVQTVTVSAATIGTNTSPSVIPSSISSMIKEEKSETKSTETTERSKMKLGKSVTSTPKITGIMTVKTKHLNLRTSASMKAKIVQQLQKSDQVNVQSWSGHWAKVDVHGVQGFVWGPYLK